MEGTVACPGKSVGFQYRPVAVFEENLTAVQTTKLTISFFLPFEHLCNVFLAAHIGGQTSEEEMNVHLSKDFWRAHQSFFFNNRLMLFRKICFR